MRTDLRRMMRFVQLIRERRRIRVKSLASEMGMSERSVYRWIRDAASELPIRLEDGVVIREEEV